ELLVSLADRKIKDISERVRLYLRCRSEFAGSPYARAAEERLAAIQNDFMQSVVDSDEAAADARIGRPFEFGFQGAVTGQAVSSEGLKGRVLVIDFWGTWCPPCVESIPHLKELNEKFGAAGVTIIGVSVDGPPETGGLKNLLSFVNEHQVSWPQFYLEGKRD